MAAEKKREYKLSPDLHDKIINALNIFGYKLTTVGACFGIVQIATQARLSNTFDVFLARLEYINLTHPRTIKEHLKSAREKTKAKIELNDNEKQALEIVPFLENVYSLQIPQSLNDINANNDKQRTGLTSKDEAKSIVSSQKSNTMRTLKLIESKAMEESGGLEAILEASSNLNTNPYTRHGLQDLLWRLSITLKDAQFPVAIGINFSYQPVHAHAIGIIYEPAVKKWRLIEPNYLERADIYYDNQQLTTFMMRHHDDGSPDTRSFMESFYKKAPERTVSLEVSEVIVAKKNVSPKIREEFWEFRNTLCEPPLIFAIKLNQLDTVEKLLKSGADPNANEMTAFKIALESSNAPLAKLLLDAGANPNLDEMKALQRAIKSNNAPLAKVLLDAGADPNPYFGQILELKSPQLLQALIESPKFNLDVLNQPFKGKADSRNHKHPNPLTYVIFKAREQHFLRDDKSTDSSYKPIVNLLLSAGADPNAVDEFKKTPLIEAFDAGLTEITTTLLIHGGNPNQKNKLGKPLLDIAIKSEKSTMVDLLLKAGATPTQESKSSYANAFKKLGISPTGPGDLMALNQPKENTKLTSTPTIVSSQPLSSSSPIPSSTSLSFGR